ncbi:hypothetical protein [Methanopyrus sp. KOL6]|uniref:hypothetical protein n=1 Tax=Methanopyrus sp. KOL6 TaxID=1937004 RepID=UPI000B4BE617|nr:hypothetical protein [Methanopyrus sp. KOL6]
MKWWEVPIRPKPSVLEKLHAAVSEPCEVLEDFELFRCVMISTLGSDEPLVRVLRGEEIHHVHPIRFLLEEVLDNPDTLVDAVERVTRWSLSGVFELHVALKEVTETPDVALGYLLELRRTFLSAVPRYLEKPCLETVAGPLMVEAALIACTEGLLEDEDLGKAAELVAKAVDTDPCIVEALSSLEIQYGDIVPRFASPARVWAIFALLCHTCANRILSLEELVEPLEDLELGPVEELELLNGHLEEVIAALEIEDKQVEKWISDILVDTVERAAEFVQVLSRPTELAGNILNSGATVRVGWIEIEPKEYDPLWEEKGAQKSLYSRIKRIQNLIGVEHADEVIERASALGLGGVELPAGGGEEVRSSVETLRRMIG